MKRFFCYSVILCMFCSFCFINNSIAESKTISIVADEWYPYNGVPGADKQGFMIDIAVEVFKEKGYTINYKTIPWNRAKKEAKEGTYDAVVGAFKEDVPEFVFPDIELGVSKTVFWVKKESSWKFDGIKSLEKIKLGVIKDYSYGGEFDEYVKKYSNDSDRIETVFGDDALPKNIRKIIKGRIDVFIEDLMVCSSELKNLKFTDEIVYAGEMSVDNVYIAFSPKHPISKHYADILTEGMLKLRESGKLKEILDKYGLKDWK